MQPAVGALLHRVLLVAEMHLAHTGLDSPAQCAATCTAFFVYGTCRAACGSRLHCAARRAALEMRTREIEFVYTSCPRVTWLRVRHVLQAETFRWARCKEAAPLPRLQRVGLPLPEALLDVLEPALAWEDLQVRTESMDGHACVWSCSMIALCSRCCRRVSASFLCNAGISNMHPIFVASQESREMCKRVRHALTHQLYIYSEALWL